jgi:hypothetical protein
MLPRNGECDKTRPDPVRPLLISGSYLRLISQIGITFYLACAPPNRSLAATKGHKVRIDRVDLIRNAI